MKEIEKTALWVAGMRALETERDKPLFRDDFAKLLIGDDFLDALRDKNANEIPMPPAIEVRTRWLDDEIIYATTEFNIRQIVMIAAGMDSRAYRLDWPKGTRFFEVDHPTLLAEKQDKLAIYTPRCERYPVAVDLRDDWPTVLNEHHFDSTVPTLWVIEGLLCYLTKAQVQHLLKQIHKLSISGSVALYDVVGMSLLQSENVKMMHNLARQFGTDHPETLMTPLGWDVTAHTIAKIGQILKRWPFPVAPRGTPGVPQSFVARARKKAVAMA